MLNLVIGFVAGLAAYKFGVTLPSLVAKVKALFTKEAVKVDVTVPVPTPSATETK